MWLKHVKTMSYTSQIGVTVRHETRDPGPGRAAWP